MISSPGGICDRSQEDTKKLRGFELSKHSRLESVTKIEDVSPIEIGGDFSLAM